MKKSLNILLLLFVVIFVNGCLKPETPESYIASHDDKEMAKAFSKLLTNEKKVWTYSSKNSIMSQTKLLYFSDKVALGNVQNYLMENGSDNLIFNTYKEAVKKRGNILSMYKGRLNEAIFRGKLRGQLKTFDSNYLQYYYYDTLPAYIEFDKNTKEMKSILFSYVKVSAAFDQIRDPQAPTEVELEVYVQSGSKLNIIKNIIPNSKFEDNFLNKQ